MSKSPAQLLRQKTRHLKTNSIIPNEELFQMVKILKIPPERRTPIDIEFLTNSTKNFSFFWKFYEEEKQESGNPHEECCKYMHVENYSKGSIIFRQGDEGDKLFFILSGEVDVFTLNSESESNQDRQQLETETDAMEQEAPRPSKITYRGRSPRKPVAPVSTKENSASGNFSPAFQGFSSILDAEKGKNTKNEEPSSQLTLLKGRRFSRVPQKQQTTNFENKMIDIKELLYYSYLEVFRGKDGLLWDGVYNLKYLNTLKSGNIFGEMALLTGKKRSATIIAMEECVFGVLHRDEFKKILQSEKKSLKQTLEFFYKVFNINLSQVSMTKLSRLFQEEKMKFRQVLFHEGEIADGFYIIKSGEVWTHKKVGYPLEETKYRDKTDAVRLLRDQRDKSQERENDKALSLKFPSLFEGQLVGDEVFLGIEKREYTAECKTEGTIYYVSFDKFYRFITPLEDTRQILYEKSEENYKWIKQRLEEAEKYSQRMLQSAVVSTDISEPSYKLRVSADKIKPLYSIMTGEGRYVSPSGKRSSSSNIERSKIFALSEVQTPNFSAYNPYRTHTSSNKQSVPFIRFSQTNSGFRHMNDALQHINQANEKTLLYLMKSYDVTTDPFSLQEHSFFDARKRAMLYKKRTRSTTTPRETRRTFSRSVTPEKTKQENNKEETPKTERKIENPPFKNFSKALRKICNNTNKKEKKAFMEESVENKSLEKSVEKSIDKSNSQRSSSVPILPKGSLMALFYMKGLKQAQGEILNKSGSVSAKSLTRTFYGIDFDTSSFARWSEKEREQSVGGRVTSERQYSTNGLVDDHGHSFSNSVIYTEEQQILADKDSNIPKSPLEKHPSTIRKGNRAYRNAIKQFHSKGEDKNTLGMQIIEEEKNIISRSNSLSRLTFPTERNFKKKMLTQNDSGKWLEKKEIGPEGAMMTPSEMRSSSHNMFRFKSAIQGRERRVNTGNS